jgi:hypothetical protein
MTSTEPIGTLGSVISLLTSTLYPKQKHDKNHKLCKIRSTEIYFPYADGTGMFLNIN